jgi:hypothetical protein
MSWTLLRKGGCLRFMGCRALRGLDYVCVEEGMVGSSGGTVIRSTLLM